jgi:hypothetical protein
MTEISYRRHRFPPVIIQHAVWLYLRFTVSALDGGERKVRHFGGCLGIGDEYRAPVRCRRCLRCRRPAFSVTFCSGPSR